MRDSPPSKRKSSSLRLHFEDEQPEYKSVTEGSGDLQSNKVL